MDTPLIESHLIEYLQNERIEVTYKMLSRKCSITVNQAKKALEHFYTKISASKTSNLGLIPLYFLCKNNNEYYVGVKPDQEEAGADSIKVLHTYALTPTTREAAKRRAIDGTIEDSLYLIDSQISRSDEVDELSKYRSILHPNMTYSTEKKSKNKSADIVPVTITKSNSAPSISKPLAAQSSKLSKSKSFFSAKGKSQKEEKKHSQPKFDAKPVEKKTAVGLTGKAPGLLIPEGAVLPLDSPASSPARPHKPAAPLKKEPVAISKESAAQATQIISMFEEDEKVEEVGKQGLPVADDDIVLEDDAASKEESEPIATEPIYAEQTSRKVTKRRKVIKSETYMEGKYLKTRDVEVWEDYESDDASTLPAKKHGLKVGGGPTAKTAAAARTVGSKTKGPTKQRSVASFFKKKE